MEPDWHEVASLVLLALHSTTSGETVLCTEKLVWTSERRDGCPLSCWGQDAQNDERGRVPHKTEVVREGLHAECVQETSD